MRTLSRYLLRRYLAPFGFTLTALTSLTLINQIAKQLPDLRSHGAPSSVVVEVLVLSVPFIVALTLPMAVLVAVLRAFTRLPSGSELSATKAGGVSVRRLITPVLGGAACIAAVSFLWNDQVVPRSNHRLRTLLVDVRREPPSPTNSDSYKGDRELTIAELRRGARSARQEADRARVDGHEATERAAHQRAAMYEVEIQKKCAIATACLVFALFGAAVGLQFPRGGIWLVIGVSFAVYTMYYVGLIGGEELGDRLIVSPFFAMWTPNLVLGIVGLVVLWHIRKRAYQEPDDEDAPS